MCIVDTEGSAPADDLTIINATLSDGSTLHDGMVILLSAKDASRVVTVKNSDAPNGVKTVDGNDIALSPEWCLVLQYVGGTWQQISTLKPATKTTLGGVMVGDGLTALDGTLSADLATAEAAGRVKASVTAASGTVPTADGNGVLDKTWLKVAMDAADAAKTAADKAQETADAAGGNNVEAYVVDVYKSGDSWYRKWSDGYIEQGGVFSISNGDAGAAVVFPTPFKKQPVVTPQVVSANKSYPWAAVKNNTLTTAGCTIFFMGTDMPGTGTGKYKATGY